VPLLWKDGPPNRPVLSFLNVRRSHIAPFLPTDYVSVCNTPQKCVFVRVVDSCAGCAIGSKHVDLTKAAFSQLAKVDEGILTVQMRMATEPEQWYEPSI